MDERKFPIYSQVMGIVVLLLFDMLNVELSNLSRLKSPKCIQKVNVIYREKNLLAS